MLELLQKYGPDFGIIATFFIPVVWFYMRWSKLTATKLGARLDQAHADHLQDMRTVVVSNTVAVTNLTAAISRCPLQGKQGERGEIGEKGERGEDGERGERGPSG